MKKLFTILLFLLVSWSYGQVGIHTDTPDNSSALEISATNRGLLIPRVTLTSSLSNPSPVTAPAVGLMVFNSGPNQAVGFYYWSGTAWVQIGSGGSGGGNDWTLTGNAGTFPGTNFIGTTDNNHFLVYTNNTERMRFENDGQVIIGGTVPQSTSHVMTVYGNSTQNFAVATYSPTVGFYNFGGRYGVFSQVDTACTPNFGFAVYAKNSDVSGYGIYAVGSNVSSLPLITNHTAAITAYGYDGMHSWGRNAISGYGICAVGSGLNSSFVLSNTSAGVSAYGNYGIIAKGNDAVGRGIVAIGSAMVTPSTSLESEGGAFTGFHGVYGKGNGYQTLPTLIAGIGVIGTGYNYSTYSAPASGLSCGGSFSGDFGAYGKGLNASGYGVVGIGSNGIGFYNISNGSGGTFAGYHGLLAVGVNTTAGTGVIGGGNDGSYIVLPSGSGGAFTGVTVGAAGFGNTALNGIGVIGAGNASSAWVPGNGCGGAFTGNYGVFCRSVSGTGTGLLCAGNNISTPLTYSGGSGGAFTGTGAGVVGYGTTVASGVGVIGAGNNVSPTVPASNGCGGAFTGTFCGVYGNATTTSGTRYGGYFATTNGQYAYVGGRNGNTNQKIQGTGSVSTIVKNTNGERITLTCPEAPEVLFQDYGIGQLVNGFAHITIDPDLAINICVNDKHPLKVFITLEGDCNGVYVTNKSANGFDVVELQGGQSSVPFSWQIVATRANEEYTLTDGTTEISDYSHRFQPAPPPLEFIESDSKANTADIIQLEKIEVGKEAFSKDTRIESQTIQVSQESTILISDELKDE